MTLKEQTINGVLWNSMGNLSSLVIEFIVGIILARLLTPKEFGLIGTIMVFITISQVFINSGFSQAIVRKQDCTQQDYSTAFFFNLIVSVLLFLFLLLTAAPISRFFNNPELKPLIQVLGIGLIISSLALIHRARLTKMIDFKLQTKIAVIASTASGIIAIIMAINGFGVWSLIAKSLINQALVSILLWIWNQWRPDFIFSMKSFKELFGFGSKLLLSGLIGTAFDNINYLVIAKYFTPQDLGYFTRAEMFKNIPSQNLTWVVTNVGYPVLATIQDDKVRMKKIFRDMFVNTFFIIVIIMAGLAATSKALILTLVGQQWLPSVELLQMLCLVGIMAPLNSMNINILNVVGRSDLYFKLQLVVQTLAIPNILLGVFWGIKALIAGMIVIAIVGYVIFNHESNKVLKYPMKEQLKDIFPSLLLAIVMGLIVFLVGYITKYQHFITLIIQVITGILIVVVSGEILGLNQYRFIKAILLDKIHNHFKR